MLDNKTATEILEAVDKNFDEQIDFTAELVKFPSVRGQEHTAQDFMAREMAARGLAVDRWKIKVGDIENMTGYSPVNVSYEKAYNVVGTHRSSTSRGRSLILNGHIDVVPTGPVSGWKYPPFEPVIDDGWMYGRGAGDMKAGLVSCLFALEALKRAGLAPGADVFLQSVIEEEPTGNGTLACLQRGYRADAFLDTEPMGETLLRAHMGIMWFQVQISGDPQHASIAQTGGANAIENAFYLVGELKKLEKSWNESKSNYPEFADHPHPVHFNLGKIEGGDWVSSVPAWCNFDMRIGFYPGWDLGRIRSDIESCVQEAAEKHPFLKDHPPRVVFHGHQTEGYVLKNAREAETVLGRSHKRVFEKDLVEICIPGATDARIYALYADTPSLVYGPRGRSIHGFNEAVEIESIRKTTGAIALFIADWCGVEEKNMVTGT